MAPKAIAPKPMPVKQWEHFRVNPPPPPVSIEACHDVQKSFRIFHMYVHVFVFVNFRERFPKEGGNCLPSFGDFQQRIAMLLALQVRMEPGLQMQHGLQTLHLRMRIGMMIGHGTRPGLQHE